MSEAVSRRNRRILLGIYGAALLYFVLKQLYYAVYVGGFPDQRAQNGYVLEMMTNPALVPDFASMPLYLIRWEGLNEFMFRTWGEVNYLGHPPLYYLLMGLLRPAKEITDGWFPMDYFRLCGANMVLTGLGLVLSFRLAYKYLESRSPFVHAVFAAALVTLPELAYVGVSVNNDNLAFLAFAIFFTGVLRYQEDKPDLKTYLLIGFGFLLGSFSKLTTALLMLLMLVVILVMSIVRTKSLKLVANRYFLMTLPCYLLFLAYELVIHSRYGVWQPGLAVIAPEYFKTTIFYVAPENRVPMSLLQYIGVFVRGIGYSWSSLYGHNQEVNAIMKNNVAGVIYWIPVAVTVFAAALQALKKEKADRYTIPVVLAFLFTLAYHFYTGWSGFLKNGYTGGVQARYYLPLIIPFAFVLCRELPPRFRTEKAKKIGRILAVVLILCWLAGDAPRLVLSFGFPQY